MVNDGAARLSSCKTGGRQALQKSVIKAISRQRFLRRDHVPRVGRQQRRDFQGCHQAGVKGQPLQLAVILEGALLKRLAQLRQGEAVALIGRVHAKAHHRPAAMVPEDEAIGLCRIVFAGKVQKTGQRRRLAHAAFFPGLHRLWVQSFNFIYAEPVSRDGAALPLVRSARHHQNIQPVLVGLCLEHLPDVRRTHPAVGFQIRSDDIDHDGLGLEAFLISGERPGIRGQNREDQERHQQNRQCLFHTCIPYSDTSRVRFIFGRQS